MLKSVVREVRISNIPTNFKVVFLKEYNYFEVLLGYLKPRSSGSPYELHELHGLSIRGCSY